MAKTFRVTTYNVLAQSYVRRDRYPDSPPDALDANKRRALLLAELATLDADVLCLQECEPALFDAIELPGYSRHFAQRETRPDGCATFVRGLDVDGFETLRFRAHDGGHELALIARLHNGERAVDIVNTHLRWQPREVDKEAHLGRRQMQEILAVVLSDTIVCGDLNALHNTCVIDAAKAAGFTLGAKDLRPWDTALINGRGKKIDYQLVRAPGLAPKPTPLPTLRAPLPSLSSPSDHVPLSVVFQPR